MKTLFSGEFSGNSHYTSRNQLGLPGPIIIGCLVFLIIVVAGLFAIGKVRAAMYDYFSNFLGLLNRLHTFHRSSPSIYEQLHIKIVETRIVYRVYKIGSLWICCIFYSYEIMNKIENDSRNWNYISYISRLNL